MWRLPGVLKFASLNRNQIESDRIQRHAIESKDARSLFFMPRNNFALKREKKNSLFIRFYTTLCIILAKVKKFAKK